MAGRRRDDLVALGGMDATRARRLAALGIRRWAAIDALTGR
jgi:thiamine monophosphate synthase